MRLTRSVSRERIVGGVRYGEDRPPHVGLTPSRTPPTPGTVTEDKGPRLACQHRPESAPWSMTPGGGCVGSAAWKRVTMTADKHTKRAARDLAAREGISYTAARRRLAEQGSGPAAEPLSEPPRLYPIVTTPCDHGCDGTPHPGYVCETWHPFNSRGNARTSWDTCQAASLPGRRADSLSHRFRGKPQYGYSQDQSWVLAAVYAMLLDEQPELAPDPHRLRTAVEADDLAAVDMLMHPLDLAAVRLLGCPIKEWWATGHPRLHAWATKVTTTEADEPAWDMTLIEYSSRCFKLAERFLKSQEERRGYDGYMETEHVSWWFSVPFLTELLRRQFGGLALGTSVRLPDGRPALVCAVEWADDGTPVAYRVRELVPGQYGNEGKLVPKLGGDGETAPAADCRLLEERAEYGAE